MDAARFDAIARDMGGHHRRRQVLGGLAGSLLAATELGVSAVHADGQGGRRDHKNRGRERRRTRERKERSRETPPELVAAPSAVFDPNEIGGPSAGILRRCQQGRDCSAVPVGPGALLQN